MVGPPGSGSGWGRAGGGEVRGGLLLAGGVAAGGWASGCDAAGAGWGGVDGGGADGVAQPVTPTPASAMVRAKNRSRSMRMLHGLPRTTTLSCSFLLEGDT